MQMLYVEVDHYEIVSNFSANSHSCQSLQLVLDSQFLRKTERNLRTLSFNHANTIQLPTFDTWVVLLAL